MMKVVVVVVGCHDFVVKFHQSMLSFRYSTSLVIPKYTLIRLFDTVPVPQSTSWLLILISLCVNINISTECKLPDFQNTSLGLAEPN